MGLSMGDSICTSITIVEDLFIEEIETFEVMLYPAPDDYFKVLIVPGKEQAVITISDGQNHSSKY